MADFLFLRSYLPKNYLLMENLTTGIKTWAEEDRPREKLLLKGKNALTDTELLAILIGSGSVKDSALSLSKRILAHYENNLNDMGRVGVKDLEKFKGIGEVKAITIIAALELGRRRHQTDIKEKARITCSKDVYQHFATYMADLQHEEFWVLYLNRANRVLAREQISIGGVAGTVADSKLIYKRAVELLSCSIILIHNHPSGNLSPSEADIQLTAKMSGIGNLMDIPVSDHLIITEKSYYSFADNGRI